MKIKDVLQSPSVKLLLFIHDKGEVRYADLAKLIRSRGTLSVVLEELEEERLIQRKVVSSKPIKSFYTLTEVGRTVAGHFSSIKSKLQ